MVEQQDLFAELMPPQTAPRHVERLRNVQEGLPDELHLGTTSWTNEDWEGLVYPTGCAAQDYLEHYARVFRAVEIDTAWYRIPTARMVENWLRRTPEEFIFTAKVPRVVSHEKRLVDCTAEMLEFLEALRPMSHRLGPLLMQFPYVARGQDAGEHETGAEFVRRLDGFLSQIPLDGFRLAVEVRNGKWIGPPLLDLLRRRRVGLVLNAYYTMPGIGQLAEKVDPLTTDFVYARFLGDRKRMDGYVDEMIARGEKERHWNELVLDRRAELERWAAQLHGLTRGHPERRIYAFFNNHYAGYAPGSLGIFARAWKERAATA